MHKFIARSNCVRRNIPRSIDTSEGTVAILAQGTNRGDALCAALLSNRVVSLRAACMFYCPQVFLFLLRNFAGESEFFAVSRAFYAQCLRFVYFVRVLRGVFVFEIRLHFCM